MPCHRFDHQQWQRYIEKEIGFVLPAVQLRWLVNAIDYTAASRDLTADQLWHQLPKNNEIRQQLLDKVLIHESRFFRHKPSISFITECALQYEQLLSTSARSDSNNLASRAESSFRIWSVGCASGQETWSLAMSLAAKQATNFTILGTDISAEALKKARLAEYGQRQKKLIPQCCQQFILPLQKEDTVAEFDLADPTIKAVMENNWQVAPSLQQKVRFALHNIMEKHSPAAHLQHVIICQNMLLYFRKFDQRDILARLSEQCVLGGHIILAPGEALFWRPTNMRRIAHPEINAWQKISD